MAVRAIVVLCLGALMMAYMDAALMTSDILVSGREVRLQSYIRPTSAVLSALRGPDEIR